MARTREYPTNPLSSWSKGTVNSDGTTPSKPSILDGRSTYTPATTLQALMEAAPFETLPLSKEQWRDFIERAAEALSVLNDRERWIVEARIWRSMSVRQVAKELCLSKTHLDRVYKQALVKLRAELEANGFAAELFELLGTG